MWWDRLVSPRLLVVLSVGVLSAVAMTGLAAANVVVTSRAGDGSGAASAYPVTNVSYVLDANDPRTISQVQFTIALTGGLVAPTTVRARINSGAWTNNCVPPSGTTYTCTFSPAVPAVSAITAPATLAVVASQ